ncbi:RING-H2 finger protein ATL78-like [Nicotiana tabacum]|uniref:RING-H2 finger protein ATL78-like n=1 Tax=Nicotiana tabacum TaxID=4097 RepID=A0AC58S5L8_TOBAC
MVGDVGERNFEIEHRIFREWGKRMAWETSIHSTPTFIQSKHTFSQPKLHGNYFHYSRRLLLITATVQQYHPETTAGPPLAIGISDDTTDQPPFDADVVMVLSVLICSIICSLIVNCLIKCCLEGLDVFELKLSTLVGTERVICLLEFGVGEKVKVLPKCNHGFPVKCIDKWLNSHSSCSTCRHCLIETCQIIVSGTTAIPNTQVASNTTTSAAAQEIIIGIESLQHEGVISNNLS